MYLFLLEPQNIIIQDHDQGQEKEMNLTFMSVYYVLYITNSVL